MFRRKFLKCYKLNYIIVVNCLIVILQLRAQNKNEWIDSLSHSSNETQLFINN